MKQSEYDEKRLLLGKYRLLLAKLERRVEEMRRWDNIALGCTSAVYDHAKPGRSSSKSPGQSNSAFDMAEQLRKEVRDITRSVSEMRIKLQDCIDQLPDARHRDVLEAVYVNGQQISTLAAKLERSNKTVVRLLRQATEELLLRTDYFDN